MNRFLRGAFSPFLVVLAVGLALFPLQTRGQATSEAASAPAFLLEPVGQTGTYFTLEQTAGGISTLTVALGNGGDASIVARTFAADVYTLINGGFGIHAESDATTGTTTWLDYPAQTLDLIPGKRVERTFTVTIPAGTPAGQYITGLVIETAAPIAVGTSTMLRQTIAKAIAVFITVPGLVTSKLEIGDASLKQTSTANSLQIEIQNAGNVLLKPAGTITMKTKDGQAVLTSPIAMGSVYAGMATTIELPIPTMLAPGIYTVDVTLEDKGTGAHAEASDLPLTVSEFDASAAPTVAPVTIDAVTLESVSDASTGKLQVVNVSVELGNTGPAVPSAKLTLHVLLDGQVVEDFPLNSSLVVASGPTTIQQRYLPLAGWSSGTYTFTVTLEAVDANSGQTTVLATADATTTVVVP